MNSENNEDTNTCVLPHGVVEQDYNRKQYILTTLYIKRKKKKKKTDINAKHYENKNSEINEDANMCELPHGVVERLQSKTIIHQKTDITNKFKAYHTLCLLVIKQTKT